MILEELELKQFLTFDDFTYRFTGRPIRIVGENLTDEGQKTNGTGKTGIQTAIEFAITSTNSRGVRDAELINHDHNEAIVKLTAYCGVRKERLAIDWLLRRKGSNKLALGIQRGDDLDFEEVMFSNVNDGKAYIQSWFAIAKDDLFNYYLINNERFKSFFKSSNKEKIDLINRFSDASILDGIEKIDVQGLESQLRALEDKKLTIETKLDVKKLDLETEISRDLDAELTEKSREYADKISRERNWIQDIKEEIESIQADIKRDEENLMATKVELTEANRILNDFSLTDFTEEYNKINETIKSKTSNKTRIEEAEKKNTKLTKKAIQKIKDLQNKLAGTISCPECEHEFLLADDDFDVNKATDTLDKLKTVKTKLDNRQCNLDESLDKIVQEISDDKESISKVDDKKRAENKKRDSLEDAVEEIEEFIESVSRRINNKKEEIKDLESQIKSKKTSIKSYKDTIKSLKVESNDDKIAELKEGLLEFDNLIEKINTAIGKVNDSIYGLNQWENNFKQFKMYIANKSLGVIEYHSNRYLEKLGVDIRVIMEGFKVLANGTYKEEITAKFIRGVERTFSSFSGGEKGRLLFASILANKFMIDSTHPYGGLNFLSIDEVFEGVDSQGLGSMLESIENEDSDIMIITHVSDEEMSGEVLTIIKENGKSRIK